MWGRQLSKVIIFHFHMEWKFLFFIQELLYRKMQNMSKWLFLHLLAGRQERRNTNWSIESPAYFQHSAAYQILKILELRSGLSSMWKYINSSGYKTFQRYYIFLMAGETYNMLFTLVTFIVWRISISYSKYQPTFLLFSISSFFFNVLQITWRCVIVTRGTLWV